MAMFFIEYFFIIILASVAFEPTPLFYGSGGGLCKGQADMHLPPAPSERDEHSEEVSDP